MAEKKVCKTRGWLATMTEKGYETNFSNLQQYFKWQRSVKSRIFNGDLQKLLIELGEIWEKRDPAQPVPTKVFKIMEKTFRLRREDLLQNDLSVKNAFLVYPFLRTFEILRCEFAEIRNMESVYEYEQEVRKMMMEDITGLMEAPEIKEEFVANARAFLDSPDSDLKDTAMAILYLYSKVNKLFLKTFLKRPPTEENIILRHQPTIAMHGQLPDAYYQVYCEKWKAMESTRNLFKAILGTYYLYYVFNLEYPEIDSNIFQPLDDVVIRMAIQ